MTYGVANKIVLSAPNGDTVEYVGDLLGYDEKCLQVAEDGVDPMIVWVVFRAHEKRTDTPSNARAEDAGR